MLAKKNVAFKNVRDSFFDSCVSAVDPPVIYFMGKDKFESKLLFFKLNLHSISIRSFYNLPNPV